VAQIESDGRQEQNAYELAFERDLGRIKSLDFSALAPAALRVKLGAKPGERQSFVYHLDFSGVDPSDAVSFAFGEDGRSVTLSNNGSRALDYTVTAEGVDGPSSFAARRGSGPQSISAGARVVLTPKDWPGLKALTATDLRAGSVTEIALHDCDPVTPKSLLNYPAKGSTGPCSLPFEHKTGSGTAQVLPAVAPARDAGPSPAPAGRQQDVVRTRPAHKEGWFVVLGSWPKAESRKADERLALLKQKGVGEVAYRRH
jgi:hypothetical protein